MIPKKSSLKMNLFYEAKYIHGQTEYDLMMEQALIHKDDTWNSTKTTIEISVKVYKDLCIKKLILYLQKKILTNVNCQDLKKKLCYFLVFFFIICL